MTTSLYDIPVKKIDGASASLGDYKGKVLLVVNVASKCGLTPQYDALEKLYSDKKGKGLEVLGFPANDFKGQEPGTNAEIQDFCRSTYGVDFPMFSKIEVTGDNTHPLYKSLIAAKPKATMKEGGTLMERLAGMGLAPKKQGDIHWNFEKFLIGRNGDVVARFAPDVSPDDPAIASAIDAELAK